MTDSSDTVFEKRFNLGERIVDSDKSNPNTAIVVNTPDVTASEWDVNERHTVASFPGNERYSDDAAVVIVVFSDELSESYPGYTDETPIPLTKLTEKGVAFYAFPAPRLSRKKASDPAGKIDEDTGTSGIPLGDREAEDRYADKRSQYLTSVTDLREPVARGLAYRELGCSNSGIAKRCDVTESTARSWMRSVEEQFGKRAIQTRPQPNPVEALQ